MKLRIKIKKRMHTLLIPYLIACLFPVAFYIVLEYIPGIDRFLNSGGFSDNLHKSFSEWLYFIYIDSGNGSPYAFHLWFLRDLIAIVVLSPMLVYIIDKLGQYTLCLILFVLNYIPIPILPIFGMFWFVFGYCFLDKFSKIKLISAPLIYFLLCISEMLFPHKCWNYMQIPVIIIGLISWWIIYDEICPKTFELAKYPFLMKSLGYTFFIYLFHEPTLNIVRKVIVIPFHYSSAGFAVSYIVSPWIFAILWIFVGMAFQKVAPRVYNICMGGR